VLAKNAIPKISLGFMETLLSTVVPNARGAVLTRVGLPGLLLPWAQMLVIIAHAMVSCLVVNDVVKVVMIKRLTAASVA
jgi:hypothetical protein